MVTKPPLARAISLYRFMATLAAQPIKPNPFPPILPLTSLPCYTAQHSQHPFPLSLLFLLHLCIFIHPSLPLYSHSTPTMPDASKPIQKVAPSNLVALPSLSNSLSSLPQAKSLAHVSVYTSSMSGQHAAESEAKVCARPFPSVCALEADQKKPLPS